MRKIICKKCKKFKLESEFYKYKKNNRGYQSFCKECCKKISSNQYFKKQNNIESNSIRRSEEEIITYNLYGVGKILSLRQNAIKRNISFNLTKEQLKSWWLSSNDECSYCGISIESYLILKDFIIKYNGKDKRINSYKPFFRSKRIATSVKLTIDRIDNNDGYNIRNIAKACNICNTVKGILLTPDETKLIVVKRINELKEIVGIK